MVLAFADAFQQVGYNPQKQLHVVAIDTAPWCVHMTYLQTSLMGIPAMVFQGNSLSGKMEECWYTPMHVFGNWSMKLTKPIAPPVRMEPEFVMAEAAE